MNLLALDTSTVACSVALSAAGVVYERHEERAREHTRLLLPMITGVLADARLDIADVDAVILGNGPGSFIGLRIAAAVAQGLCHASGARLVPLSSLAAVAQAAMAGAAATRVLVAQDAHMHEVYLAAFEAGPDGSPCAAGAVRLCPAGPIADLYAGSLAAGAGWHRYPALWQANRARLAGRLDILYPRAASLLAAGAAALERGRYVDPERLEPAYVREHVAQPAPVAGA